MDPDPDLDAGLRDSHSAIHDAHPHARHPSRLDGHDPSKPPVSYSTANHAAACADADANANAQGLAQHAAASPEPDAFYQSPRALSPSSEPDSIPMASPALRPNGDGTAARHLQLPASPHPGRQTLRSASSPLDGRPTAMSSRASQAGQPSVRDLKKRFDQHTGAGSITRLPLRQDVPAARLRQDPVKAKPPNSSAAYTSPRAGVAPASSSRETQTGRSQRSRQVAQEQVSSSSQSFASRVGKPRSGANGNSIASKSMTHLPHKSQLQPPPLQMSSPNLNSASPGLLCGEGRDVAIDEDSGLGGLVGRQRSFSNLDAEPSSPSGWYRDTHTDREEEEEGESTTRARSRSDGSDSKPATPIAIARKPAPEMPTSSVSNQPTAASRLPISIRKLNSPTNSSASSTRSNSPSKRPQANAKTMKASPPTSRAKTPTQTGRKQPSQSLVTPISNPRLQAYIAAGPPRLSPPLRSSRPRQPVSVASTASSRMKETGKVKSPPPATAKDSSSKPHDPSRRVRLSVGPIDFEQRREHIRLAYSKSIRESQVFEVRQKAVEKRRKEMEGAGRGRASTSAISAAAASSVSVAVVEEDTTNEDGEGEDANADTQAEPSPEPSPEPVTESVMETAIEPSVEPVSETANSPVPALTISTDLASQQRPAPPVDDGDSPTLGAPPSFSNPAPSIHFVERPQSTVSATSETTEFDVEPQTEPTVPAQSPSSIPITSTRSSGSKPALTHSRAEYQFPFDSEALSQKPLPPTPETVESPSEPVAPGYDEEQAIPGAYYRGGHEGHGFVPHTHRIFETSVTILPQSQDDTTISEEAEETIPFPRLEMHDDSDCASEFEMARNIMHELDDTARDACTEYADDHDDMEEQRSLYRHGDGLSLRRASMCESSDAGASEGLPYLSNDQQSTMGSSNKLLMPPSRSMADRLSHQTAWTDFSIESVDQPGAPSSPAMQMGQYSPYGRTTFFDPEGYSANDDSSLRSLPYNGLEVRPSMDSARLSEQFSRQHLPELDTGDGFSIPYLSPGPHTSFSSIPSPNHEPPPVPPSGPGSALDSSTSSVFYEQSQYESTLINSDRGSDEFTSHLETPQSMDMTPSETPDQYFGSQTPGDGDAKSFIQESGELSDKERHRLVQRRNVIKELVDTEAVFVRDMNIVEEIYKGTAEACPNLDSKTVKLIFRNTDEIIEFHTSFLAHIKDAVADVYVPPGGKAHMSKEESLYSEPSQISPGDLSDAKDRVTSIGPAFQSNMEKMKVAHESFLRNSDQAAKRLIQIQQDPTVKMWLNECNEVATDLTAAWDLDSLLIKPMQRITKYPNLIMTLLQHTPQDHPDREALVAAKESLEEAIIEINKAKKNFELVGQIVGRKRKESDVKAGLARAFGKRVDKLQGGNRPPEDPEYAKLEEKFSDDYLRLQVVLRDVEFYTRQVSSYVHEFLQYLSAIELVMRLQPGNYPELESKWVQFNISVRDLEKVALEQHLGQVRKHVIEPFEHVIQAYGNPSLAMKKRQKRRVLYERSEQLKRAGKSVDPKLKELVEQYEALNDTLIKELPKLSVLTEKVGNICLGNLINIQTNWYGIWKDKMKAVLSDTPEIPDMEEVVTTFQRDFPYAKELLASISIINPAYEGRVSQSTTTSKDDILLKARSRPSEIETRGRGLSVNGEPAPVLPAPDFGMRNSGGSFAPSASGNASGSGAAVVAAPVPASLPAPAPAAAAATTTTTMPNPHQYYYRDYYANIQNYQPSLTSPRSPEMAGSSRSLGGTGQTSTRPSTGRSFDSAGMPRQSTESAPQYRRDSNTTYNSSHQPQESRQYSNLFHSALPLPDGPEEAQRSSRASSRERACAADGYNILWLAASLFEFNIATTKHEAGYPYLTYQAGEIFDVIAEKGELWLAKNQDDSAERVGWIWSKHFARLADG